MHVCKRCELLFTAPEYTTGHVFPIFIAGEDLWVGHCINSNWLQVGILCWEREAGDGRRV